MENLFSGIKPSGDLTLGNYLGAIVNFIPLQDRYNCFYCVVDMHAITVPQDRLELRQRTKDIAALYIACGLNPEKSTIYIQSEVSAHAELGWMLECNTYLGELNRMTQFKDKANNQRTAGLTSGIYTYPVLMAADILLYDSAIVPVGVDQKQHVELCRDIADRFNNKYGDTFVKPDPLVPETGAKIMDLQNPTKKMSKSDTNKGCILLLDSENVVKKKIRSAVTDTDGFIKYDVENKPGISNLMAIHSIISGLTLSEVEAKYVEIGYGDFKNDVAELVWQKIKPIQERFNEIRKSQELDDILDAGATKANKIAYRKVQKVKHKIGLGRKKK